MGTHANYHLDPCFQHPRPKCEDMNHRAHGVLESSCPARTWGTLEKRGVSSRGVNVSRGSHETRNKAETSVEKGLLHV